jgi:hypothetical protein
MRRRLNSRGACGDAISRGEDRRSTSSRAATLRQHVVEVQGVFGEGMPSPCGGGRQDPEPDRAGDCHPARQGFKQELQGKLALMMDTPEV